MNNKKTDENFQHGKNYKDKKDMKTQTTKLNSPEKPIRKNNDEQEAPENLHNESPGKREKNTQRKHHEKKTLG